MNITFTPSEGSERYDVRRTDGHFMGELLQQGGTWVFWQEKEFPRFDAETLRGIAAKLDELNGV